jgi:hypothetical protein
MVRYFPRYGLLLLSLALPIACDQAQTSTTSPTAITSESTPQSFSFEPAPLRPEALAGRSCAVSPAFGTRVVVVVNGGVLVRSMRFSYIDRAGIRGVPDVTFIASASPLTAPLSSIHTGGPVPIPTGLAPIPSTPPVLLPGTSADSSQRLPFFLSFGCGLSRTGTLFVMTDVATPSGGMRSAQFSVPVGN